MIVDDSSTVLALAGESLSQAGFDVQTILYPLETGELLSDIVFKFRPHLILSDVDMPLVRGDELVGILRKMPSMLNTKVYFHSSQSIDELERCVAESKANGFILKSKNGEKLVKRVQEILR